MEDNILVTTNRETLTKIKDYLIALALTRFNTQLKLNLTVDYFDAITIRRNTQAQVTYELYSTRSDDHMRIRLHCTLGNVSRVINAFTVCDDTSDLDGEGDDVYVADATLDNTFLMINNNQVRRMFDKLDIDPVRYGTIVTEDGIPIISELDEFILREESKT